MGSNPGQGEAAYSVALVSDASDHGPRASALQNASGAAVGRTGESAQLNLLSFLSSTLLQLVSNLSTFTPASQMLSNRNVAASV